MPKVYATDLVLADDDGNETTPRVEEWVRFRSRVKLSVLRVAAQLDALNAEGVDVRTLGETFEELTQILRKHVLAWNWTDLDDPDRPALPQPNTAAVFWELDLEEIMWLVGALAGGINAPKN